MRRRGDDRAIFPDLYAIITELVAREVHDPAGLFWEPAFISRLSGRFAERYVETLSWSLRAEPQDCVAWSLAYGRSGDPALTPFQHAALGICAHINFDLALGIQQTLLETGAAQSEWRLRRIKHDHDQVNALLEEAFPLAVRRLSDAYGCRAARALGRLFLPRITQLAVRALARWREEVWDNVLALLRAPSELSRRALLHGMDRRATRTARLLSLKRFGAIVSTLTELPGAELPLAALGTAL